MAHVRALPTGEVHSHNPNVPHRLTAVSRVGKKLTKREKHSVEPTAGSLRVLQAFFLLRAFLLPNRIYTCPPAGTPQRACGAGRKPLAYFHSIRYRHKATLANVRLIDFQKGVQMNCNFHLHTFYPSDKLLIGLLMFEQCLEA